MRVEFHPEADEEFVDEVAYLEMQVSGLGGRFIAEVERAIALLVEHPKIGAPLDAVFRHVVLRRFPVSLIYALEIDRVFIVAVAHQRRCPGYWHARTS